jgi:hypothetical protein
MARRLQPANHHPRPPLCRSKWISEAFSQAPGCSLYFEFEHCLRAFHNGTCCASAEFTLEYLNRGCACSGVDREPGKSGFDYGCSGCALHPMHHGCRASGVQFGALGTPYQAHIRQIQRLSPTVRIVLLVRSNTVKHSLSFLRVSCGGINHKKPDAHFGLLSTNRTLRSDRGAWITVPPQVLLFTARSRYKGQQAVVGLARRLAGGDPAYTLVYEAAQRDLAGEIANLLKAIGALPLRAVASTIPTGSGAAEKVIVKSGADNLSSAIANYAQLEHAFRQTPCLHRMLIAVGPVVFGLNECKDDLLYGVPQGRHVMSAWGVDGHASRGLNDSQCQGQY